MLAWKMALFSGPFAPEVAALIWSAALGMVHLLVIAHFQRLQHDLRWIAGARHEARAAPKLHLIVLGRD